MEGDRTVGVCGHTEAGVGADSDAARLAVLHRVRTDTEGGSIPRLAVVPVVVALAAGMTAPAQAATETDYSTHLKPASQYPGARGDSEYEREGGKREVEVTVTGIRGLAGRRVAVYISGRKIGTMRVSSTGRAHRDWSTSHGQSVPSASAGSTVKVRTSGGMLIASGRYRLDTDD